METKFFQTVSVEKELPKEQEPVFLIGKGPRKFSGYYKNGKFEALHWSGESMEEAEEVTHFLREFSLPELMEEYRKEFEAHDWNFTGWTIEDFQNDFFTKKRIL